MTEFIGTSLAFGEHAAQLLPWDGSLIAMVTVGQSSHNCLRVTVHECLCFLVPLSLLEDFSFQRFRPSE